MGTHKKTAESKNNINRGYLVVVLKGKEISIESKMAEIKTEEIKECLYLERETSDSCYLLLICTTICHFE